MYPPRARAPVREPNQNDIKMGQGGFDYQHEGNVQLRNMALESCNVYEQAHGNGKRSVARGLVHRLRALNPPGRFLKRDDHDFHLWHEVAEEKAVKRVQQVYREAIKERKERQRQALMLEIAEYDQTHLRNAFPLAENTESMEELGCLCLGSRPRKDTGGSSIIFDDIPPEIIGEVDRSFFSDDGSLP